jgi:hypothetical protein
VAAQVVGGVPARHCNLTALAGGTSAEGRLANALGIGRACSFEGAAGSPKRKEKEIAGGESTLK